MSRMNNASLESCYEMINVPISKKHFYEYVKENTKNNQFVYFNYRDKEDAKLKILKADLIEISCKPFEKWVNILFLLFYIKTMK